MSKAVPADELHLLDEAARVAARRRLRWPRRKLSPALSGLMWILRLYVVGMLGIIGLQLSRLVS